MHLIINRIQDVFEPWLAHVKKINNRTSREVGKNSSTSALPHCGTVHKASPVFLAASATALATAGTTLRSNPLGII